MLHDLSTGISRYSDNPCHYVFDNTRGLSQSFQALTRRGASRKGKHGLVVPRVQAAYALTDDGRTVVKGGWGRYGFRREINPFARYDPNAITYGIFHWRDLNGNNDWDLGETNRDPNGPDFIETRGNEFGALPPRFVPNPNEKQVIFDEFSVNLERELMANFSLRVTGIYSQTKNVQRQLNIFRPYEAYNIPVTNRDPGPDGRLGTADDGGVVTYWEYAPELRGLANEVFTPVNDSRANMSFRTIEVAALKRLANRWQLLASFSATKKNQPLGARNSASALGFGTSSPHVLGGGRACRVPDAQRRDLHLR